MTADSQLPVPAADTRRYVRITPSETRLDPETVTSQFERLHGTLTNNPENLLNRLDPRTTDDGTVEVLLVATHEPATRIDYYVGVDPAETHPQLERRLAAALPDSYACETVQWAPTLLTNTTDPTAVEYRGVLDRRRDWQTRLTPLEDFQAESHARTPLATVVETLTATTGPALLQLLVTPKAEWAAQQNAYRQALEEGRASLGDQIATALVGPSEDDVDRPVPPADRTRLEELEAKDPRRSFTVSARALVYGDDAGIADELTNAFTEVSQTGYAIDGQVYTGEAARDIETKIRDRQPATATYDSLRTWLPGTRPTSPGIVVDASELGSCCLLDGSALTTAARQALAATPGEREPMPLPPPEQLEPYSEAGLPLGRPLTQDATPEASPINLPPALQPLHVGWFGKTGSGKSTALVSAILDNHVATDGADILIDPKGDGMAEAYMRAHYARHGDLEDVVYFDCREVLPAIPVLSVEAQVEAGIERATAVQDVVDHYMEMLRAIMGADRFDQAVRSPDIIRYLLRAQFDPVNGSDAITHRDLHAAVRELHERQSAPAVSDDDLERLLAGVVANSSRSFDEIMQGVNNRIEKIPSDPRLARIFNHVPDGEGPTFDLGDRLDDDCVIILDTGGLRAESQRVLTLVVLSNLWTALRRRARQQLADNYQLVNVYLEEAASVATSGILQELLSQARSFGCSLTLAMQFPTQLRAVDEAVYRELLNNVSTYVVGNVPVDRRLAERLATADAAPSDMGDRLRALRRGEWLLTLPAPFDEPEPRPFQVESLDLPPGHPDRAETGIEDDVEAAIAAVADRTRTRAGLTLTEPSPRERSDDEATGPTRVDSALPHTRRLPQMVAYDADAHALECTRCGSRYDPVIEGMRRTIKCCGTLDEVDRADVPICELNLKLSADERAASDYSTSQLCFLQAVYNAQQQRYDPLAYDLLSDSMVRLREYVGIDSDAVQDLLDDGVLSHDTDRPHRLYTVPPAGRDVIGESYRRGVEYGHEQGDLEESSEHVLAVEAARLYLEQFYGADPDSPVEEVVPYYELREGTLPAATFMGTDQEAIAETVENYAQRRLDLVGLDADGEIRIAVEAERVNNDVGRAVPADYDKLAACDPDEAIWVVMSHTAAHDVLEALHDPLDGEPRVEKTYADSTPASSFAIDQPGFSDIVTVAQLLDRIDRPDRPD